MATNINANPCASSMQEQPVWWKCQQAFLIYAVSKSVATHNKKLVMVIKICDSMLWILKKSTNTMLTLKCTKLATVKLAYSEISWYFTREENMLMLFEINYVGQVRLSIYSAVWLYMLYLHCTKWHESMMQYAPVKGGWNCKCAWALIQLHLPSQARAGFSSWHKWHVCHTKKGNHAQLCRDWDSMCHRVI